MKIILDESVPQNLRLLIEGGHTVVTAWYQGWYDCSPWDVPGFPVSFLFSPVF
jgi:hypothetical protein